MSSTQRKVSLTGTSQASLPGMGSLSEVANRRRAREDVEAEKEPKKSFKERRAEAKARRTLAGGFKAHPHLMELKPVEGYFFHSDYFDIDGSVACILSFFHDDGSHDDFSAFWGIPRIPEDLGEGVTTVVLEQVRRMGEKWIDERLRSSERLDKLEEQEVKDGTSRAKRRSAKISDDVDMASAEIQDGAAYLHVHNRLMVKAPTVAALDRALEKINRNYIDHFGTLKVAPYPGEQRKELSSLFAKNKDKRGAGFHFTSTEYAGSYHLVTNGLNDPAGEYVGYMIGDVNTSAVLFDVDLWERHVVVADNSQESALNRAHRADMWGSKISQAALLNNRKVVHIVLDGADMDQLGPKLSSITARLDMSFGDINMFEMFGSKEDELSVFPAHLEKLVLMVEQAYSTTENDRSVIRGSLKETLTQFYIDKGMWQRNAKTQRERLRLVDLPHDQVPRMQDVVSYFDTAYTGLANSSARDDEALHAYSVLRLVFRDLLDNQGDLFNTYTNPAIDSVGSASRVIYDFSRLIHRGQGVAMAQLVNVVGFAVNSLGEGDVVVIHGTEEIDDSVKDYVSNQLKRLYSRGGRVAYLYNDVDQMLEDSEFSRFDAADYTILGPMRDATVVTYREKLHQQLPPDLERMITRRGENVSYLRRKKTNVVFRTDLALGVSPAREATRRAAEAAAGKYSANSTTQAMIIEQQQRDRDSRLEDRSRLGAIEKAERERRAERRLPKAEQRKLSKTTKTTTTSPTSGRRLAKNR